MRTPSNVIVILSFQASQLHQEGGNPQKGYGGVRNAELYFGRCEGSPSYPTSEKKRAEALGQR